MARINGKKCPDAVGMTVEKYLEENNYNKAHIVVELNEEILPKSEYSTRDIAEGDIVEIVAFMGGGSR
ncbi:MAG: sulfur carrier protein ThiS [Huintestinicola sp.]